jgi:hypothetical protein
VGVVLADLNSDGAGSAGVFHRGYYREVEWRGSVGVTASCGSVFAASLICYVA